MAAYLTGREAESADLLADAHHAFLAGNQTVRAARSAAWLALMLRGRGDHARSSGWVARARRLLDEGQHDSVERGYVLLPKALEHAGKGELSEAEATFAEAARIGERFSDQDLVSLARQGRGRALIGLGQIAQGVALLDEVMTMVTSTEISPIITGIVYCSVISACFDLFDIRRAQEWTEALNHWCESQPERVPYRGECRVQRTEILLLHGVWPDAMAEARRACEWLSQPPVHPAAGAAYYQLGELHRLRGEFTQAEDLFQRAAESGRTPQPGLALLRLAQDRCETARAAITRVVEEARDRRMRSKALAAATEILLAAGDVEGARTAAYELDRIAAAVDTPFLRAIAAHAKGAVQLAEGQANAALASLREACTLLRDLQMPYEAARTTTLIGLACRELGDLDGAQMELGAARRVFQQLGAAPDLARVERLSAPANGVTTGPLTIRETEVLKLIASGKTNRAIADALSISEKTVARHISNIFTKLDLSSRAGATAYAFKHKLV